VVGWAVQSYQAGDLPKLSPVARGHIGYVALYGDPKRNPGGWWERGNVKSAENGVLHPRAPYITDDFRGRFGGWCDNDDNLCASDGNVAVSGNHGDVYGNYWIWQSAGEIAAAAKWVSNLLAINLLPSTGAGGSSQAPPPPPPPVIKQVKRTLGSDGARQVYATTKSTVTEAYWFPGSDGVHPHEIIHITQGDIVGFDKVNLPENKQALYTAVLDGIWESTWQSGTDMHSAKIISGLSGVRKVIADNRWETQGYTHRLYVLASNGPHEYWWRDGGDGIHHRLINNISGAVTMVKSTGPDGADQLYVATPTWVYELWWKPNENVHHSTIINITQGDIRSLSKGVNLPDGGQLLYTTTSTTVWQSWWHNCAPVHGTIATGQSGALQGQKTLMKGYRPKRGGFQPVSHLLLGL
jgi:hypothetical protein